MASQMRLSQKTESSNTALTWKFVPGGSGHRMESKFSDDAVKERLKLGNVAQRVVIATVRLD